MKLVPIFIILISLIAFQCCGEINNMYRDAIKNSADGNYERSIEIWKEILNRDSENPLFLNNLGWTLFRNDDLDEAITIFEKAKSICKDRSLLNSIEINLFMVMTFIEGKERLNEGDYKGALMEFDKAVSSYDTKELGMKYLALCLEGLELKEEAKEKWKEIVDLYKESGTRNEFYLLAKEKLSISE